MDFFQFQEKSRIIEEVKWKLGKCVRVCVSEKENGWGERIERAKQRKRDRNREQGEEFRKSVV